VLQKRVFTRSITKTATAVIAACANVNTFDNRVESAKQKMHVFTRFPKTMNNAG
jgi:tellurite resistance protein